MLKYFSNLCLEVNFMAVHEIILGIILLLLSVAIIVLVLLQEGKSAGLSGAIAGGAETFFGKNKSRTMESKLVLITKIVAISFFVLALVATLLLLFL
nr:MAG TPA: Protein translocase subunit SecY, Protein, membrane protein, PROTEIN TRANSPORT-IMMUNE [Bacteriophage sp.]